MASLKQHVIQAERIWRDLRRAWSRARGDWNDSVRQEFDRDYWQPVSTQFPLFLEELRTLEQTVDKARREVR